MESETSWVGREEEDRPARMNSDQVCNRGQPLLEKLSGLRILCGCPGYHPQPLRQVSLGHIPVETRLTLIELHVELQCHPGRIATTS